MRGALRSRGRAITADGGTSIPSGLREGLRALDEASAGRVKRVVIASDGLDNTRAIAEELSLGYVYFPSSHHTKQDRDIGNAILSPWPIEERWKVRARSTAERESPLAV